MAGEDRASDAEKKAPEYADSVSSSSSSDSDVGLGGAGTGSDVGDGDGDGEAKAGGSRIHPVASRRSFCSRRSQKSGHLRPPADPYEDLARALTPDPAADAELAARHEPISHTRTATTIGSTVSRPPDFEVVFDEDDGDGKSDNPRSWPLLYRAWVIFCVSFSTWVVVFHSTNYTASTPGLMAEFHTTSVPIVTLGVTSYLVGLAVGSVILAPLSELYGRRPVYIICMVLFAVMVVPTALATSLAEIIVLRFFGALFGAAMISNSPGTVVDISNEEYRALCMSLWSIAPVNGPVTGPLIGGFVFASLGWRWDNWLALILAGVGCVLLCTVKETYAPAILKKKAALRRKETGDERWWCRYDQSMSKRELIKLNLSRPFTLALTEPILWFFNIWISLIYGILYLCFVAYPIVFTQHRGWGPGIAGLAFVGIGIGTLMAIASEPLVRRMINAHPRDPETGRVAPEASASAMLIGAVLTAVGQLGFSWTSMPVTIHWAAPIAFGIPFGCGNTLCFIYGSNYLAGAYGIYAASALAGNAVMRSFFGGTLPLAGPAMYEKLTPQWAGTLLGLLEVLLIPIPWAFYRYGEKIRARSPVIRQMREDAARNESRRANQSARAARRAAAGRGGAAAAAHAVEEGEDVGAEGVLEGSRVKGASADVEKGISRRGDTRGEVTAGVEEKDKSTM